MAVASQPPGQGASRLGRLALALALIGWIAIPLGGLAHRVGALGPEGGLLAGFVGAILAVLAALVLALIAILAGRRGNVSRRPAYGGLVLALSAVALVLFWLNLARSVPPIHDIATDMANPPAFVAVLPARAADQANSTDYTPAEAALQKTGYPDIQPLILNLPPAQVFARALDAARAMGWSIVASDPAAGRIEATDTTFWMGFKDDIMVRITAAGEGGSRVDVRSESRAGRSDIGANARRIRSYLEKVKAG